MSPAPLHVLGIVGSLRKGSFNRHLLHAARELAPPSLVIESYELASIPLFNGDYEQTGFPEPVAALRAAVARADGVLIATPEYNYSIPGVVKNALDWVSRGPVRPFAGKPVAIMSASTGAFGGVRSQLAVRVVLQAIRAQPLAGPEVTVMHAASKFDADGRLTDATTRELVAQLLVAFADWIALLKGGVPTEARN